MKNLYKRLIFYQKNKYYITSLKCKLKVKGYIDDKDEKIKKFSEKSRLLLEKCPPYQIDLNYLLLESLWYVKQTNHPYQFKRYPKIIDQYSYKYKFCDTTEKKNRDCQIYSPFSQLIGKRFNFERKTLKGINLIVQLDEQQKLIESFFLHRSPKEDLNYFLRKNCYRDINLYFVYDRPNRQWLTSGIKFYNGFMCEKMTNPIFKLNAFMKKILIY